MSVSNKLVKIGCASAFWGDTAWAAEQLVKDGQLDYLVFDYLAEVTMSIMAGAKMKNPDAGFAPDFVQTLKPLLSEIAKQKITVISNAGGVNVNACAAAMREVIAAAGVDLTVGVVLGDDLSSNQKDFAEQGVVDMFNGEAFPKACASVNAYLGAPAICDLLAQDADIIITGRVVDSAVVLAPLMHEFDWAADDYDKLAQASLAGHIIECGAQCTGGNFTDWHLIADGYANMGFPVIECKSDGSFVVTKPKGTGGLVTELTVGEQMVYEIGDTQNYMLPDVICDFSQVTISQLGEDRVEVKGALGKESSAYYKVSATYLDGYRCTATFLMAGFHAAEKGNKVATAIVDRSEAICQRLGIDEKFTRNIEMLGSETTYGPHSRAMETREVVVKIAVHHHNKKALGIFSREIAQAATAMAPGLTGLVGGRPSPTPCIRLFSFLIPKDTLKVTAVVNDAESIVAVPAGTDNKLMSGDTQAVSQDASLSKRVPLIALAVARSGDKGNHANIGVIARDKKYHTYIEAALQLENVSSYMGHILVEESRVSLYGLPGVFGFNLLFENVLAGGGMASLKIDPQGKALAQQLLAMPVLVSEDVFNEVLNRKASTAPQAASVALEMVGEV